MSLASAIAICAFQWISDDDIVGECLPLSHTQITQIQVKTTLPQVPSKNYPKYPMCDIATNQNKYSETYLSKYSMNMFLLQINVMIYVNCSNKSWILVIPQMAPRFFTWPVRGGRSVCLLIIIKLLNSQARDTDFYFLIRSNH